MAVVLGLVSLLMILAWLVGGLLMISNPEQVIQLARESRAQAAGLPPESRPVTRLQRALVIAMGAVMAAVGLVPLIMVWRGLR
ncbi:MAG: hypothetical protein ACOY93_21735 [Bacillota bacterium]